MFIPRRSLPGIFAVILTTALFSTPLFAGINPVYNTGACPAGKPMTSWWSVTHYDDNGVAGCIIGVNCDGQEYKTNCGPMVPPPPPGVMSNVHHWSYTPVHSGGILWRVEGLSSSNTLVIMFTMDTNEDIWVTVPPIIFTPDDKPSGQTGPDKKGRGEDLKDQSAADPYFPNLIESISAIWYEFSVNVFG